MKIEISIGELVDKITILKIKLTQINDENKLKNISQEHDYLVNFLPQDENIKSYFDKLFDINLKLWHVEDLLRDFENQKKFDEEFIECARSVYHLNDERARIKKNINLNYNSSFVEEKSYNYMP